MPRRSTMWPLGGANRASLACLRDLTTTDAALEEDSSRAVFLLEWWRNAAATVAGKPCYGLFTFLSLSRDVVEALKAKSAECPSIRIKPDVLFKTRETHSLTHPVERSVAAGDSGAAGWERWEAGTKSRGRPRWLWWEACQDLERDREEWSPHYRDLVCYYYYYFSICIYLFMYYFICMGWSRDEYKYKAFFSCIWSCQMFLGHFKAKKYK